MDPIRTTSGKTAKENIAALRQRRMAVHADHTDDLIEKLDALADQAYRTVRAMRSEGNALRLLAIEAKQMTVAMRKQRKVDLEL